MKSIDRERVLRLNCPGFGEESHLNLGRAKSLDNYQVIIANPVSLLHLFDKGPEPTRRINQLLSEGVNQLNVPDDALIQELINESDSRLEELIPFLSQGGLLIYFLCRPFVLAGPTISVDNYDWLSVYAPATKNPPDNGSRQMSALSHGRVIETTEEGNNSEMAEYLNQSSIEWNTIIRTDFLSSNYSVLATAAQKKCIAAQFWAGDNGGKVIFLPAPYSPDFDRVLMTCVNKWYQEAIEKGYIKDSATGAEAVSGGAENSRPDGPDFYSDSAQPASTKTMDEARLEEIMANLASNHQKSEADKLQEESIKQQAETGALEAAATPAPSAKQPPKGALKGLFSSDALGDDDDDDFSTPLPVTKVSAEEILQSVSAEAERQSSSFQELEAIPAAYEDAPERVASEDNSSIDVEAVPVISEAPAAAEAPNNFELKKATAEMDLSMFAETARQLVQKANQIETATRDPNVVSGANPKQKISDILKGLEFGGESSIDELDAEFGELPEVAATEIVAQPEAPEVQSTGLNNSLMNLLNPETKVEASGEMTDAERERAEIESSSRSLESFLRPESAEANLASRTNTPPVDFAAEEARIAREREEIQRIAEEQAEQARRETQRILAEQAEQARIEAEREAEKMANFRETFEFLKDEDPVAREYQPESITKETVPKTADELQTAARAESTDLYDSTAVGVPSIQNAAGVASVQNMTGVSSMQNATGLSSMQNIPPVNEAQEQPATPQIYGEEEPRSSLRSLMKTLGAPRLEPAAGLSMFDNPQSTETHESLPQVQAPSAYADDALEPAQPEIQQSNFEQPAFELTQPATASPVAEDQDLNTQFTPVAEEHEQAPVAPAVAPQSQPASQADFANPALVPQAPPQPAHLAQPAPAYEQFSQQAQQPVQPQAVYQQPPQEFVEQQQQAQQPASEFASATPSPAAPQPIAQAAPMPAAAEAIPEMPQPAPHAEAPAAPPMTSATLFASLAQQTMRSSNGDGHRQQDNNDIAATPQPKELIKKMEEMTKTAPPTWCDEFSFPFIDLLKNEHSQVSEQIRQMQSRLGSVEARIRAVDTLKVILLTGENDALMSGAQEVLSRLGWQVQQSRSNANELWLSHGDQVEAIARVVHGPGAANRTEVAQLAESVIAFWDEYETEPKGILIAQTWSSKHPAERTEPDFSPALQEFASKKHLSLMSTMQLLSMYKDVELSTMPVDEMRKRMLETSGRLLGFPLDSNVAQAASGAR